MDPLAWYERMDAAHQQSAYALAWHLCRSEDTAVRRIIPAAVEIACKNIRNRDRRERDSPTGWKILLSEPQSLQIGILEAAKKAAQNGGGTPGPDPWLAYVAHLALCTLPRNSFYVAVGFEHFLTNGSTPEVLELYDFLAPCGPTARDPKAVSSALKVIKKEMAAQFPGLALIQISEIPKQNNDPRYQALTALVPWESRHVPNTKSVFTTWQGTSRRTIAKGLGVPPGWGRGRRRRSAAQKAMAAVEIDRAHICICQQHCLARVQQWWGRQPAFTMWRIPQQAGMHQAPTMGPWQPPTSAEWDQINEEIMRGILWWQRWKGRRAQRPDAMFEVRVDGQVQAVMPPDRRDAVMISLPASARYVEIQDREHQTMVATCHLMDPHDLPPGGWQRAVPLPDGGRLRFTFSADPDPETEETGICMAVEVVPALWPDTMRRWVEPVWERVAMGPSRVPSRWATVSVVGLLLLSLALNVGFAYHIWKPQVTVAVSYKDAHELIGISDVAHTLGAQVGGKMALQYTALGGVVRHLEEMVASGTMQWDLIIVDNDTLGTLVQKDLVEDLSRYKPYDELLPGTLLDPLKALVKPKPDDHGRYYFVPFRPNVKLTYYDADTLRQAGYSQPPTTSEELEQLAHALPKRVALQAYPAKAAAVTVFEFVKAMGGDPLTLADEGARQAFTRLWNLAPVLAPESTTIQFDSANEMLIDDQVSVVSNWTYGIKVVMEIAGKTHIKVAPTWLEGGTQVLGGDMLAIPKGAPHPERAIQLIELLVAKQTQRDLAERLFWAPVREDVYAEISAQEGRTAYFQVIREALRTAVPRPTTPEWILVEEVLSDALQDVLRQGAQGTPATAAAIDALLRPYTERLKEIPHEYIACRVVRARSAGDGGCTVEVPTEKSFEALARDFQTTPAILAKVNGRNDRKPVSPTNMQILLVPKPLPGS